MSHSPVDLTSTQDTRRFLESALLYIHSIKPVRDTILALPRKEMERVQKMKKDDPGVHFTLLVSKLFRQMRSTESPSVVISDDLLHAVFKQTPEAKDPGFAHQTVPFLALLRNVEALLFVGIGEVGKLPAQADKFFMDLHARSGFDYSDLTSDGIESDQMSMSYLQDPEESEEPSPSEYVPAMVGVINVGKEQGMDWSLPKTLTLDMYYAGGSKDLNAKRITTLKLQKLIAGLQAEDAVVTRASEEKKEHKEESKEEMSPTVTSEHGQQRHSQAIASARQKINDIWKDGTYIYELSTVITYEKGRAVTYQRDHHSNNRWQRFGGETVSDVTEGNLLRRNPDKPILWAGYFNVQQRDNTQVARETRALTYKRNDFLLNGGEHVQFPTVTGMTPTYIYLDPISLQLICHTSSKGPSIIDPAQTHFHVGTITEAHRNRENPSMAAIFQDDGNLVIELYDKGAPPSVVFSSRTNGYSDILVLGGEHRLELYDFMDGPGIRSLNNRMTDDNEMLDRQDF